MNERRREVLEMLAGGKITADEAERLLSALEKEPPAASAGQASEGAPKAKPKYLRVVVDAGASSANPLAQAFGGKSEKHGPTKINVRVPMQLLRAGVRLASLIPPQAQVYVNDALREKGLSVDLSQLKPENLEELIEGLGEVRVDIDDKDAKVAVFCE